MKKLLSILSLIFAVSFSFSCSEDDEPDLCAGISDEYLELKAKFDARVEIWKGWTEEEQAKVSLIDWVYIDPDRSYLNFVDFIEANSDCPNIFNPEALE